MRLQVKMRQRCIEGDIRRPAGVELASNKRQTSGNWLKFRLQRFTEVFNNRTWRLRKASDIDEIEGRCILFEAKRSGGTTHFWCMVFRIPMNIFVSQQRYFSSLNTIIPTRYPVSHDISRYPVSRNVSKCPAQCSTVFNFSYNSHLYNINSILNKNYWNWRKS